MKREATILNNAARMMADEATRRVFVRLWAKHEGMTYEEMLRRLEEACIETIYVTNGNEEGFVAIMNERLGACVAQEYRDNINKVWGLVYRFLERHNLLYDKSGLYYWLYIHNLNRWMKEELGVFSNYYDDGEEHKMLTCFELASLLSCGNRKQAESFTKNRDHYMNRLFDYPLNRLSAAIRGCKEKKR